MIRKANVSDSEAIQKICRDGLGYECSSDLVKSKIERLDWGREAVFVAEIGGMVAGFVHVEKYNVLYFEEMANILGLAVAREYRKQGLGRLLMEAAEAWAEERGIHAVRLNSGMSRKGAHEFYRAVGYGEEKEQLRFMKRI